MRYRPEILVFAVTLVCGAVPGWASQGGSLQGFSSSIDFWRAAYDNESNPLKKSFFKERRDKAVFVKVPGGGFSNWPATVKSIMGGRDDALLEVVPEGCRCTLGNTDIGIPAGSKIYQKMMSLHEGDRVTVSGYFVDETSLTDEGSMDDPEWRTHFESLER